MKFTEAKRAKELEEEELRRQEAAKDQADAGSPREETGKHEIYGFKSVKNLKNKCNSSELFITQKSNKIKIKKILFTFFLHAA